MTVKREVFDMEFGKMHYLPNEDADIIVWRGPGHYKPFDHQRNGIRWYECEENEGCLFEKWPDDMHVWDRE